MSVTCNDGIRYAEKLLTEPDYNTMKTNISFFGGNWKGTVRDLRYHDNAFFSIYDFYH